MTFTLGKQGGSMLVQHPGKPILVDGTGNVIDKDFKDVDAAVQEAKRLARKGDDDVYVYIAKSRVGPTEPKVEEIPL